MLCPIFWGFRIPMNPMIYWKGHPNSPQSLRWCWFHGWCVLVHPLVGGCWFCMVLLTPNYIPGMMTLEAKKQNDGVLFWESSAITCYDMSCHGFSPCFFAIRCTLDARRVWSASFRWAAGNTFPTKVTIVSSSWLVAVGQLLCLGELKSMADLWPWKNVACLDSGTHQLDIVTLAHLNMRRYEELRGL